MYVEEMKKKPDYKTLKVPTQSSLRDTDIKRSCLNKYPKNNGQKSSKQTLYIAVKPSNIF